MIPFIKNKLRFVSVFLLLASLVTVVSSASAEPEPAGMDFSFNVQDCSPNAADWSPQIQDDGQNVYPGSTNNTITAITGFVNGTPCGGNSMEVNGTVDSNLEIETGGGINLYSQCEGDSCLASVDLESVSGYYDVPMDAVGTYSGRLTLTWTPE